MLSEHAAKMAANAVLTALLGRKGADGGGGVPGGGAGAVGGIVGGLLSGLGGLFTGGATAIPATPSDAGGGFGGDASGGGFDDDASAVATVAGSRGTVSIHGTDAGSITSAAVRTLNIGGNLSGATVDLTSTHGTDLTSLTVAGTASASSIRSAASIGAVTVGGMSGSSLFAGVAAATVGLPIAASDLTARVGIKSFADLGRSPFAASDVAAYTLGAVALRRVATDDCGTIFGTAAPAYESFSLAQPKAKLVRVPGAKLTSTLSALGGDLRVEVL